MPSRCARAHTAIDRGERARTGAKSSGRGLASTAARTDRVRGDHACTRGVGDMPP